MRVRSPLAMMATTLLLACGSPPAAQEPDSTSLLEEPSTSSEPTLSDEVARGQQALEAGDVAGATSAFEAALAKNPNDAEANYFLGLIAEQSGDGTKAEQRYQAALKQKPGLEHAAINLSALYLEGEKAAAALTVLKPALERNQSSPTLWTNQALALALTGDNAGAKRAFERAEKLTPDDPNVLILHASWLSQWKDSNGAKQKLLAARSLVKDDAAQLASVAFELKNAGAFPECVGTAGLAIQKHSEAKGAGELRVLRGLCKLGEQDKAGALADFVEATKVEPTFATGFFYLGGRYAEQEQWAQAESAYTEYLKLSPSGELAAKAKERLALVTEKKKGKKKK